MYRKYKVTSCNDNRKETTDRRGRATPIQGKYSQTSLGAPTHNQQPALITKEDARQQPTSSLAVAKQQGSASFSLLDDASAAATVEATWKTIEEQSAEEMRRRREEVEEAAISAAAAAAAATASDVKTVPEGWKTIRVFVSSTFADMHSEREILVKKVFPELREWCEERKFSLVDCDLRWGVPKDSPSRTTICTCLEEIDRCHEDNDRLPFFVSILSERYGWIPSQSEVPEDVKDKYDWVTQTSITHMEILHGAYRFNNPNAIFCLRNPSYVEELPADKVSRFVDQEELNQLQLKVLRQQLYLKFPNQIFEYNCRVDGVDMSTGREKVNIVGLESFAEKILVFLKAAIDRQYPNQHLASELSPSQTEQNAHSVSMQVKSEFFVGREMELQALFSYIRDEVRDRQCLKTAKERQRKRTEEDGAEEEKEDDKESVEKEGKEKEEEEEDGEEIQRKADQFRDECLSFGVRVEDSSILSVVGQPGIGKSSLLAKLAITATEQGLRVLYHSVGTTDVSTTSNGIIRRIVDSLKHNSDHELLQQKHEKKNAEKEEAEEDGDENQEEDLLQQLKDALANAAKTEVQLLIIIDGLDEFIDNDTSQFLSWLPPRFPGRLQCIVSSAVHHHPCIARLESRDSLFLDLEQLTPAGAASMAEYYLQRFNKRLDAVQLSCLLSHRSSGLPLWLAIACEELRVFGDFATVSTKIKNFPDELNDLMKDVFQRLIREDETKALQKVLSWIHCSKSGLPEKAILSLLGNPAAKEPAPIVTWATVRRHLKPFIRSTGESQSVRIRMAHASMNKAVEELLFSAEREEDNDASVKVIQCHSYLADYYQYHCPSEWMTLSELPHHLYHARLGQRMVDFYRTDERTTSVTGYERSRPLNSLRCQGFVHNFHNDASNQLYICHMCSMRSRLLSPNPMPTTDLCAICGNWSPWKQATNLARLCMRHAMRSAPSTTNCYICRNVIFINSSSPHAFYKPLYLCNYCHVTGSTIMKCAHLDK